MKLRFIFVGKTREKYLAEGIDDFQTRIKPYLPMEIVVIKGAKARDDRARQVRDEDTRRLLGALGEQDLFVHLDPRGRAMTSPQLADWLKDKMDHGASAVSFGLGGPLGLGPGASKRANLRLSLSKMTFTHEMSRLILLEQVYRALRVIAGHPYHK